ncbi:MAG: DUF5615 family PIN-like protein [Bauldia sp.]
MRPALHSASVKFVIDAQLPPGLATRLVQAGCVARHVSEIGLVAATDTEIWDFASSNDYVLLTKDQDFAALSQRDRNGPAVVWIRLGNVTNQALWQALEPRLAEIVAAVMAGERLIEVA